MSGDLSEKGKLALRYAGLRWYVFPIAEGRKDRPISDWSKRATTNSRVIEEWWKQWPEDNIGIATGPSRLCVVNVDIKDGKNGPHELELLELLYGNLKFPCARFAYSVQTPSGGIHLYFQGLVRSRPGNLPDGVDIRSSGAYVLAPGSELENGRYKWKFGPPKLFDYSWDAPKWLLDLARASYRSRQEYMLLSGEISR